MQAAVLHTFGSPLELRTLSDPQPGPGEVVVAVAAAPVLSYAREVFSGAREYPLLLPLVPGCGAVGRVHAVGPDATRLQPGDWVFCDPTVRSRDDAIAPDLMLQGWNAHGDGAQRLQAHFRDGPFAERVLLPMENAVRIGSIDPGDAARWCWLNTLLVPYGGLLAGELQPGETVLVSGATGHFGSAGVAVALAMGAAQVIAPGRNQEMLAELSRRFGPRVRTVRLSGSDDADRERMQDAAPGPIDRVLDLLPPLPDASPARAAALTVRPHGTVVLMGGIGADLHLPYRHLMRNCITVRGQWMYPRDAPGRLARLVHAGLLDMADCEVTTFALTDANAAVEHAAANGGPFRMTVLQPQDPQGS
ncbi:MAG TPA: zinc-binding dehydrogenase [Actinopolymorphaceae bacterium]|nr:zinc-binding dehydrogenase [Actinopolymorphaceae bacterium]